MHLSLWHRIKLALTLHLDKMFLNFHSKLFRSWLLFVVIIFYYSLLYLKELRKISFFKLYFGFFLVNWLHKPPDKKTRPSDSFFYRVVCVDNLPSNEIIVKKNQFYPDKKTSRVITVDYSTSGRGEYFKQTLIIIFIQGNYYLLTKLTEQWNHV
jgi:hypothetical protein